MPDMAQKPKIYVVFLSIVRVALKRTDLGCKWLRKESVVWLDNSKCFKWRPSAFARASCCVCHWSIALSMMPRGIRSQVSGLQLDLEQTLTLFSRSHHSFTLNISQTATDTAIVTIEGEQETAPKLLNGTNFNDFEWPLTQISRSRYYSTSNNSKMVQDRAIFTMGDQ